LPKVAVDGTGRLNDSLREEVVKLRAQVDITTFYGFSYLFLKFPVLSDIRHAHLLTH
jgi:hypothetical protein